MCILPQKQNFKMQEKSKYINKIIQDTKILKSSNYGSTKSSDCQKTGINFI